MTYQKTDYPLDYSKSVHKADRPEGKTDTVSDPLDNVTENGREMGDRLTEQVGVYGDKAQDATKNVKPYLEKSLREQPVATLVTAAAVAFALGALWRK